MFNNLGGPTLLLILFIVLLLFGAPKLPALARSLGQSMKILKKEVSGDGEKGEKNEQAEGGSATENRAEAGTAPASAAVSAAAPADAAGAPAAASIEEELAKAKAEAAAAKAEAEALRAAAEKRKGEDEAGSAS